jgi:hypothetical protein
MAAILKNERLSLQISSSLFLLLLLGDSHFLSPSHSSEGLCLCSSDWGKLMFVYLKTKK